MRTTLYYFSGTGNSLVVARDIAAGLDDAQVVRICAQALRNIGIEPGQSAIDDQTSQAGPPYSHAPTEPDNVGIVAPVYHTGLPTVVSDFLGTVPIDPGSYVFAVATYGDGPGVFFNDTAAILRRRQIRLAAGFGIQMPHNVHASTPAIQAQLLEAEKQQAAEIARTVAARRSQPLPLANPFAAPLLKLTRKVAARPGVDSHFTVDDNACIGCDICAYVCPADNITMVDGRPRWAIDGCQECLACLQWCPRDAIGFTAEPVTHYHHPAVKVPSMFVRRRTRQ